MNISGLLSNHAQSRRVSESPHLTVIRNVVKQLLLMQQLEVVSADILTSTIHLTYLLILSDGSRCIFKCSPGYNTRLLRRENHRLENESRALHVVARGTHLPVPKRIKYGSSGNEIALRPPYLLRRYLDGTPLSHFLPHMSAADKAQVDWTLGVYFATLATLTAPKFGRPYAVSAGVGSNTWREAFLSLLEAALRDAEDALISLPYNNIRYLVNAQSRVLDMPGNMSPALVSLSFYAPEKVLLKAGTTQITGLLGLDDVLWGDPEMAFAFVEPTTAFLEAYGRHRITVDEGRTRRFAMYSIYRSVVEIVKHHYRPRNDEDDGEARKNLTLASHQLAELSH